MLGAKPTVFVSHSEKFKEAVAIPFRDHAESLGMNVILVSEMPTPEHGGTEPDAKVDYYLDRADMFVALMTPDDRTDSGEVHARPNVTDEITRARMRSHLRARVQVFKAPDVDLHSNINPTYEILDPADIPSIFPIFERQAQAWEILAPDSPSEAPAAVGPIGPSDSGGRSDAVSSKGALGQAVQAVEGLRSLLLEGPTEDSPGSPSAAARAHLSASVALSGERSTSPFGVHELNGLFRERTLLDLTSEEERFLLRTILLQSHNENAPGWYWFRRRTAEDLHRLVVDLAMGDPDEAVRARSLEILTLTARGLGRRDLKALLEAGLGAEEERVRNAALQLLAKRGDTRLLRELGDIVDTPEAAEAVLLVRSRHTPVAGLRALLDHPSMHSAEVQAALLKNARKLPVSLLRRGLRSDYSEIRRLSLSALDRSSRLRREDALAVIETGLPTAERMAAFRVALKRGWSLTSAHLEAAIKDSGLLLGEDYELRAEFHSRRPMADLLNDLSWIGGSSWAVYAGLGAGHFDDFADQIRTDLDSDFKGRREEYRAEIERVIRADVEQKLAKMSKGQQVDAGLVQASVEKGFDEFFKDFTSLEAFTLKRFQVAALRALVIHGTDADAEYGRRLVAAGDRELTRECVRLLARVGNADDAPALIDAAKFLRNDDSVLAAEAALAVSGNSLETIAALIDSGSSGLIKAALVGLDDAPLEEATRVIFPLLRSPIAGRRRTALDRLIHRLDRDQQMRLIDIYVGGTDYYYYNVVVGLDRRLYAPGWLRQACEDL